MGSRLARGEGGGEEGVRELRESLEEERLGMWRERFRAWRKSVFHQVKLSPRRINIEVFS